MQEFFRRIREFLESISDEQMYVVVLFSAGGIALLGGAMWLFGWVQPKNATLIASYALPLLGAWVFKAVMPTADWGLVLIIAIVLYFIATLLVIIRR
jgi:hypothetical protein